MSAAGTRFCRLPGGAISATAGAMIGPRPADALHFEIWGRPTGFRLVDDVADEGARPGAGPPGQVPPLQTCRPRGPDLAAAGGSLAQVLGRLLRLPPGRSGRPHADRGRWAG